jgi:hypothetical protein
MVWWAEDDSSGMERSLSDKYMERWSSLAFISGVDLVQVQVNWSLDWMNEWVSVRMVHVVLPQRGAHQLKHDLLPAGQGQRNSNFR